jgi:hypothetical protein
VALIESLKKDPNDFGGIQPSRLPTPAIEQRWCCARFCARNGRVQIAVPGGFRVVCGQHAVLVFMMTLGILGDPSPVNEVRQYAEKIGVDWDALLRIEPKHPTLPEHFCCLRCGGGYYEETIGMFAGKRYIHNCGE